MSIHQTSDGRSYVVRTIQPFDREHLVAGLAKMSPATRFQRFLTDRTDFSPEELDFLLACDGQNHIAYVCHALGTDGEECEGVAAARFFREADNPEWGEAAIVVIDDWQNIGVGSVLLDTLAEHCRRSGVRGWRATILADNDRAIKLLSKVGTICGRKWEGRSVEVSVDIAG